MFYFIFYKEYKLNDHLLRLFDLPCYCMLLILYVTFLLRESTRRTKCYEHLNDRFLESAHYVVVSK